MSVGTILDSGIQTDRQRIRAEHERPALSRESGRWSLPRRHSRDPPQDLMGPQETITRAKIAGLDSSFCEPDQQMSSRLS